MNMKAMKMNVMRLMLVVATFTAITSCSSDDDSDKGETIDDGYGALAASKDILFENGKQIGNGDKEFCFIGNQTIEKGTYTLKGWVYVRPGATLTIKPGVIIKGDKATQASLIIEPGGKLIAEGTASQPIVFTSAQAKGQRRPGDWGGLIICGKAPNNQKTQQIEGGPKTVHGGNDTNDNSGIIRFVRVEFAGYPFQKDKEINGITLGSVGSGTQIDHLQVSYSNDDSYEWFGGTVNCKYLVAYNGWDDEFDTDNGFSGRIQFCLSVRDPRIADTSQSNGFESDNSADGATVSPFTQAQFSNVTFVGPMTQKNLDAGFINNKDYINAGSMKPDNEAALGKFQAAMHIRRSSQLNCYNSVALGWPIGLIIDGEKGNSREFAQDGKIKLQNVFFALANQGNPVIGSDFNKKYEDELATWDKGTPTYDATKSSYSTTFFKAQRGCKWDLTEAGLMLSDPTINGNQTVGQVYLPTSGSPLLNAADFTSITGFNNVTYIGAFSENNNENWLEGWTNFDPVNTDY